jgi:lipoate-protein ligase A
MSTLSSTSWRDHDWRLLRTDPLDPLTHMALDAVLADEVAAGRRPPTLRIWEWSRAAVVIGRFQSLRNEVDADGAARHGVQIVRRVSGGGAMFIEPGNTITYSIYAPGDLVRGLSFQESYAYLDQWVLNALASLGLQAFYQPINDIATPDGKIGGAAQARRGAAVLHHVTLAYDLDADKMMEVLRIGKEKLSDKGTISAKKRVDPLRRQTGMARGAIIDRMLSVFRDQHGLSEGKISSAEWAQVHAQIRDKYATPQWLALVP